MAPKSKKVALPTPVDPTMLTRSNSSVTHMELLSYFRAVKETLIKDDERKFHRLLKVMKDFKEQRINTEHVVAEVQEIMEGHYQLFMGFNVLLPDEHKIPLPGTLAVPAVNDPLQNP